MEGRLFDWMLKVFLPLLQSPEITLLWHFFFWRGRFYFCPIRIVPSSLHDLRLEQTVTFLCTEAFNDEM